MRIKWAHSILDWRSHAVDEQRRHPIGVFKAECGHVLTIVVELRDEPRGQICEACAMTQTSRAMTLGEGASAGSLPGREAPTRCRISGRQAAILRDVSRDPG